MFGHVFEVLSAVGAAMRYRACRSPRSTARGSAAKAALLVSTALPAAFVAALPLRTIRWSARPRYSGSAGGAVDGVMRVRIGGAVP